MKRIPLRDRTGAVVVETVVDDDVFETYGHLRWFLKEGYVARTINDGGGHFRTVRLHRLILGLGSDDHRLGEHVDCNPLNNLRSNLRIVEGNRQNSQNRLARKGTRIRGVSWKKSRRKWVAQVQLDGRKYHLGLFDDAAEAASVVAAWRREHMPWSTNEDMVRDGRPRREEQHS